MARYPVKPGAAGFDWLEVGLDCLCKREQDSGRALWVEDGHLGMVAVLPPGMRVREALGDYASGYDAEAGKEISLDWHLFDGPDEVTSGTWTFVAGG